MEAVSDGPAILPPLVRGVNLHDRFLTVTKRCSLHGVAICITVHLSIQICHAIIYIWSSSITHLDIKPANILVCQDVPL